jgi:hypothetical protein
MNADSYVPHPAKGDHWDSAGDEVVVVRIIGEGSVETAAARDGRSARHWPNPE